jgi:plastocyanin
MAAAVLLGLVVAACGGNTTEPTATPDTAGAGEIAGDPTVAVSDNTFGPTELTVAAGTAVSWNWDGSAQHNVVGDGFESPTQAKGTFEHTFGTPGTYTYVCTLHQGMDGTITVVER